MKKFLLILIGLNLSLYSQTLISDFNFSGNMNDDLGNSTCINNGNATSSYTSGMFNWTLDSVGNGGLKISIPDGVFTETNYSIAIEFKFSQTSGYRKVVDFSNLLSDQGIYVNTNLRLYSVGGFGSTTIPNDSMISITFLRNGTTNASRIFLQLQDSTFQLESNGDDVSNNYVPALEGSNRVFHFFRDDTATTTEYSLMGTVNRIRIWNGNINLSDLFSVESYDKEQIVFYPNPVSDIANLYFENPTTTSIQVINTSGQIVLESFIEEKQQYAINLSHLVNGIYWIRCKGAYYKFVKM